jgi:tetratricopeptide (TPR) repeat protein
MMRYRFLMTIRRAAMAAMVSASLPQHANATGAETQAVPPVDPAPCMAAIAANDDDRIMALCGAQIDSEKATPDDRMSALIARAAVFARKDQIERAIADYDTVLNLDPKRADIFNARGELWWKKGDRPRALADFAAAIKLNPDHATARGNYKSLAMELERLGAQMAVAGKPGFDCAAARRPVEKAICADPDLADLDRQISAANAQLVRDAAVASPRAAQALRREQDEFLARRNALFGRADYDLRKVMRERLDHLLSMRRQ